MNKTRSLIFGSVVVASMIFGGVISATVFARTSLPFNVSAASSAASPSPSPFKSNEAIAHESGESAAQETAENNGTFHPGGPGGPGPSNETAAHEAGEPAARESAETT